MYAVVKIGGGKQYRVEPGKTIDVEKLPHEAGTALDLSEVLLVVTDGGEVRIGQPTVSGAVVKATVVEDYRGDKVLIWKYRPGLRYRRRRGHRQTYTRLRIESVTV